MRSNVLFFIATVVTLSQALDSQVKVVYKEYAVIDNATYYIDILVDGYHRDEAKAMCESLNMTLISFEGDELKWNFVNDWLYINHHAFKSIWTDALRDEGSTEWYWESSGNKIKASDMRWAPDEPTMDSDLIRSCINFSFAIGGYNDYDCLLSSLGFLCQYST